MRQHIDCAQFSGEEHGVVEGQIYDRGADSNPDRRRREIHKNRQGIERAPINKRKRTISARRVGGLGFTG